MMTLAQTATDHDNRLEPTKTAATLRGYEYRRRTRGALRNKADAYEPATPNIRRCATQTTTPSIAMITATTATTLIPRMAVMATTAAATAATKKRIP